jgi:N-acetylglutamate synthase-like GNAT family acetyltransferase
MSNDNPAFYRLIGPLMGSRTVEKEVGIRMYDDGDKCWYTAWHGDIFAGVASVRCTVVSDCYIKPQYRRSGALTAILESIVKDHAAGLRATCTSMSRGVFERAGFTQVAKTKNFYRMER